MWIKIERWNTSVKTHVQSVHTPRLSQWKLCVQMAGPEVCGNRPCAKLHFEALQLNFTLFFVCSASNLMPKHPSSMLPSQSTFEVRIITSISKGLRDGWPRTSQQKPCFQMLPDGQCSSLLQCPLGLPGQGLVHNWAVTGTGGRASAALAVQAPCLSGLCGCSGAADES